MIITIELAAFLTSLFLGHATVTRGESRRDVQLADLVLIELENEGPKPDESVPCMIMTMRQGKQNQHGKIEYMGCMRNVDPILCPLSALAFYFFNRWGKHGAQPFPSFRQPEDYYGHYVFPGSVREPERALSYPTQFGWNKKMFQGVGIHSKEKTHSPRKQSVRHAELVGVSESQIRRAGRWNTDAMTGVYLSYLPREFMRSIAGFPQQGKGYFLPRAQEIPDEALCRRIWPETDVWLERMEAYHPDRTDNEVVRLDLAGSGFLRLLRALRVILLQDSVVLRRQFPLHPLWADPLFNCEEYRRFAARVESSLVNVVTPDELTMQKYWPAHDAVAKLRHEAAISEIRETREIVRSISDRLDKMERSSASYAPPVTPTPAVWVQQGTTAVWVGPTASARLSSDGSRSIRVPISEAAAPSQSPVEHPSSSTQADVAHVGDVQPLPYVSLLYPGYR
ncbi:MAG: hypothetical protein JOZ48_23345 [Acidobacteriaceae bacterium]|nr:hypothetical protein [Acidobacteriaceae bacterium]